MRNRSIQRKMQKLLNTGMSRENIRIIREDQPKQRSEIITKKGPVKDPTPWEAIKTETRLVVKW